MTRQTSALGDIFGRESACIELGAEPSRSSRALRRTRPRHLVVLLAACGVAGVVAAANSIGLSAAANRTAIATSSPSVISGSTGSAALGIAAWLGAGGQAELTALGSDFSRLAADASTSGALDNSTFAQHCSHLVADVADAERFRPIPDTQAQAYWSKALVAMHTGGVDCVAGATGRNRALLDQGLAEAAAGTDDVQNAADRFQALTARAKS
ncbi:hypothetical protein ABIA33_004690 [Streptacidiphilus sp. MAP12-16]|uniref:hypothetical protein n=1 Tax=Streptacidiphilus sp. MAP12-16 TaxID=3156300 RepID=UPI003516D480